MKIFQTLFVASFLLFFTIVSCSDGGTDDKDDNQIDDQDTSETEKDEDSNVDEDSNIDEDSSIDEDSNVDEDPETDDDPIVNTSCIGLSTEIAPFGFNEDTGLYESYVDLGNNTTNLMSVLFYSESYDTSSGSLTFDLSEGLNTNYSSCNECITFFENIKEDETGNLSIETKYFQRSGNILLKQGKMETSEFGNYLGGESEVEIKDLILEEAIFSEDGTFTSTTVENGKCYQVDTTISWNTICVQNCEGKICGDNGCGGSCGECEDGKRCNSDGSACEDYSCQSVTLQSFEIGGDDPVSSNSFSGLFNENLGIIEGDDSLSIEFYIDPETPGKASVGTYDLGEGDNKSYASCTECFLVFSDANNDNAKLFFQEQGTIAITQAKENTMQSKGTLSNIRLVESTMDSQFNTQKVQGGECLEITSYDFDTYDK